MTTVETLALVNACLNGTSAVLAGTGWVAMRFWRSQRVHRVLMWSALVSSTLFLASYVTRYSLSGNTPFAGQGWIRSVYFGMLISHVTLALATLPLVIAALSLAARGRYTTHRKVARIALPVWSYVSVTGVLVYMLLYHSGMFLQ